MNRDRKTVSNQEHELRVLAKEFGVELSDVLKAKEVTGSNDREILKEYLNELRHNRETGDEGGSISGR